MPNWESNELDHVLALPREERKRMVSQVATREGFKAAVYSGLMWSPVCAYFKYGTPPTSFFNSKLSTSARTAVLISVPLLAFGGVSEQVASRLGNPDAYLQHVIKQRPSELNVFKQFANYTLAHPFSLLIAASVPVVGIIGYHNSHNQVLSFSQMVMHTRVMGQFSVLVILAGTMGFYDYMRGRGPFLEPWEVEALRKQQQPIKNHA